MTAVTVSQTHAPWQSSHGRSEQASYFRKCLSGIDAINGWLKLTSGADVDRSRIGTTMVALGELKGATNVTSVSLANYIARIAASKDEGSFEALFRYFAPRLKSYFMRLGADVSVAEEITQETMVQVWRNAAQFNPSKASASTWIFTIARNLSIDTFRRTRRPSFDPSDPAFIPDGETLPDLQMERAETEQRVRLVMNSLSPNEKSVLILSFYENFSHGEIAQRLGIPLGTVKSRIRLAFAKVRSALAARHGEEQ